MVYVSNRRSLPCFIRPVFSIVVLWNVYFLSVNQSDCRTFQTSKLKKRLCYIKHVRRHRVTKHSSSQQINCLCLVIVRHVQRSLSQLHSKILETPITQEKFKLLSYWTPTCRWKRFLWFHHCQYVGRSVGQPFFLKRLIEFFWNFSWS